MRERAGRRDSKRERGETEIERRERQIQSVERGHERSVRVSDRGRKGEMKDIEGE